MSPLAPQPSPKPGTAPHSVDLVVRDLEARKVFGVAKYGVAHQHDNGRDHLVDAYQEALDLAVYLRAEIERKRSERARAATMLRDWALSHIPSSGLTDRAHLSLEQLARDIEGTP